MFKWQYDKMINEYYGKKSKEELAQEIMLLQEIECSDRCFANECEAGTSIYNINELFSALKDLQDSFTYQKAAKVFELVQSAESSWDYIKNGISRMNDPSRCSKALEEFKTKLANASDKNDSF